MRVLAFVLAGFASSFSRRLLTNKYKKGSGGSKAFAKTRQSLTDPLNLRFKLQGTDRWSAILEQTSAVLDQPVLNLALSGTIILKSNLSKLYLSQDELREFNFVYTAFGTHQKVQ